MSEEIPQEIQGFLRRYIKSIGQLDILYLLTSDPARLWTPEKMSAELRANVKVVDGHLRELHRHGLVLRSDTEDSYRCSTSEPIMETINKLIYVYNLRRPAVIHFIYSQPMESIQNFSDAFNLKKDKG